MMKITEILAEADSQDVELLQAIKSGRAPVIMNATYSAGQYAWGNLERLGLARRGQQRKYDTIVDEWWEYSADAPGPITLYTHGAGKKVMQPGDVTDPVEVDYS